MNPLDRFRLDGRRALITGSTMGIGLGIAEAFAGAGAQGVLLNSEAGGEASETALARVRAAGPQSEAGYLCQDLSLPAAGTTLARAVVEATGGYGVDILVLNAGVQVEKPWMEITPAEFQLQISVNLQSGLELLQGLVPLMEQRQFGRVIIISSVQASKPAGQMLVYAGTKAALNNQARNLARQLGPHGITVNTISPGIFNTPRNATFMANAAEQEQAKKWVPVRRVGEPEDCAGIAILLASEAGSYMNGADYRVDGGTGA